MEGDSWVPFVELVRETFAAVVYSPSNSSPIRERADSVPIAQADTKRYEEIAISSSTSWTASPAVDPNTNVVGSMPNAPS